MSKITIVEQDLTGLNAITNTEHIVYVPGYSEKGPINEPTLVRSIADFTALFGSKPFKFKNGELEKSWIYASELIRAGLPVLYERVYDTAKDVNNKAKYKIEIDGSLEDYFIVEAKYVGSYGLEYKISITSTGSNAAGNPTYDVTINNRVYTNITFNKNGENYLGDLLRGDPDVDFIENITTEEFNWGNVQVASATNAKFTANNPTSIDMDKELDIINLLNGIDSPITKLTDKSLYDVKFITSGGYPNIGEYPNSPNPIDVSSIGLRIRDVASQRGDALGLIDMVKGTPKTMYKSTVASKLVPSFIGDIDKNSYVTMIAPHIKVHTGITNTEEWMPGSFAYLMSLGNSVVSNPIWFAVAGAVRGRVSNVVETEFEVDSSTLNTWQFTDQCINPIRNTKAYGYIIDGNRTLNVNLDKDNVKSLAFTNIRIIANEIKKIVDMEANRLAYETNDIILWKNFQSKVEARLEEMQTGRGIEGYKLTRLESPRRGLVRGSIKVLPNEAVESFEIFFSLEDQLS